MYWLSESIEKADKTNAESPDTLDAEIIDNSLENAIALYRKVRESINKEPTEKEIAEND